MVQFFYVFSLVKHRLQGCQPDVEVWQRILQVRALVLSPEDDAVMWIKFANLCRKSDRMFLAEKTIDSLLYPDRVSAAVCRITGKQDTYACVSAGSISRAAVLQGSAHGYLRAPQVQLGKRRPERYPRLPSRLLCEISSGHSKQHARQDRTLRNWQTGGTLAPSRTMLLQAGRVAVCTQGRMGRGE